LAVSKSGGRYAIDPAYPIERMLHGERSSAAGAHHRAENGRHSCDRFLAVVTIDSDELNSIVLTLTSPDVGERSAIGLCIFTSGSTGQPQGVQVTHGKPFDLVFCIARVRSANQRQGKPLAGVGSMPARLGSLAYLTAGASLYLPDVETRVPA